MKLRVLGCHGGELPSCRTTCFLLDDVLALDAGALTQGLELDALGKVSDICITHSHFDHVKDIPLLSDLLVGRRDSPVTVHASTQCAKTLRDNVFNDLLWPDFTQIPSRKSPVLQIKSFKPGAELKIGKYKIMTIPVSHPVESCGFVVSDGKTAFAMSGDTGPTDKLWKVLNATKGLKMLLLEASFPNSMQALADISGHLTPNTVKSELDKFQHNGCEVMLYHLKPAYVPELKKEVKELGLRAQVLEIGDTFEL